MSDEFEYYSKSLNSPVTRWAVITPSDVTDLGSTPKAIFVTVAGNVTMRGEDGIDVTFPLAVGMWSFRPRRIMATGTTASVVGVYG